VPEFLTPRLILNGFIKKKMKKIYLNPTVEVVEIDFKNHLLAGSLPGAEGGGNDGGTTPGVVDPTDPGFGGDY